MTDKENKNIYICALAGAVGMSLLRFLDQACLLSAVLVIFSLTALVYSVHGADSKKAIVFTAGMIMTAFTVRFYGYTGMPFPDLVLGLLIGLIMFIMMSAERWDKRYTHSFIHTLFFPVLYLLFMWCTEIFKINMPFRLDTYFSCLPVLCQITSLAGSYILDFLIAWTASVLVFCTVHKKRKRWIAVYVCMLCFVFGYGMVHMHAMNEKEAAKTDTVRVACGTGPYYGTSLEAVNVRITLEETLSSLETVVEKAAVEEAEILLFNEEAYGVSDQDEEKLIADGKRLAEENDMHILLAYEVEDTDDGKNINKLCWISDDGEVIYDYTKHCLVPFVETADYVQGDRNIEVLDVNVHGKELRAAAAICYDADFDLFMSHMGKNIDLLLLPAWDWKVIAEEHFSTARLRAITSETTLVRSVYDGWSAVIDSAGNVLMRANTNDTGYENVIVYDVPVFPGVN